MTDIVVNTVLWFMNHRMKLMTKDDICKVISDFFDCKEVKGAKEDLYKNVPESVRPSQLKRFHNKLGSDKEKSAAHASDIYILLQALQNDSSFSGLTFATVSCQFPPLDIGCIDAVALYADVLSLKRDMRVIKTKSEEAETNIDKLKVENANLSKMTAEIKIDKDAAALDADNFAQSLQDLKLLVETSQKSLKLHLDCPGSSDSAVETGGLTSQISSSNESRPTYASQASKGLIIPVPNLKSCQSLSPSAQREEVAQKSESSNDWKTVAKKHHRPALKLGKRLSSSIKTVAPLHKPAEVFLSRLSPETSEENLVTYVNSQFKSVTNVTCNKLNTKYPDYSSFKLSIHGISFKDSVDPDNWPQGTLVKRFFSSNSNRNLPDGSSTTANSTPQS